MAPLDPESLLEGIITFRADGTVGASNRAASRILRREPVDADGAGFGVGPVIGTGIAAAEADVERPDAAGRPRLLRRSVTPGPHGGATVAFLDMTERRTRERALSEAHQQFHQVFDGATIGMAVTDTRGGIVSVNRALSGIIGRATEGLTGSLFGELAHPAETLRLQARLDELLSERTEHVQLELRLTHASGDSVWCQVDATLLRDADARPVFGLVQVQDVSERRRHQEHLEHLADHDALTGLLNRRGLTREIELQAQRTRRYGPEGALLLVDLDNFKHVNDTLGHKAGDEVIREVAERIVSRVRRSDVVARLGGDEFAVLIPRGGVEDGQAVAAALLEALRTSSALFAAAGMRITASIGLATFDGAADAEDVLVQADLAMYDAKEGGRDSAAPYLEPGSERRPARERMRELRRIRTAVDNGRLRLLAQPIQTPSGDGPVMYELLLRMLGDDGSLISPEAFLHMAERFDLVQEIDRWVVGEACGLLGAARRAGQDLTLTVNLSGKSVGGERILGTIRQQLAASGADPHGLVLEITETSAVAHIQRAVEFANGIRALGCRLAIDDFGSGFGSFHYLKHLPFDFLKIDGEFVTNGPTSRVDELIVDAVRDLAHGLGRQVIAEFCADERLACWLTDRGIDLLQGFHVGRPAPVEHVLAASTADSAVARPGVRARSGVEPAV